MIVGYRHQNVLEWFENRTTAKNERVSKLRQCNRIFEKSAVDRRCMLILSCNWESPFSDPMPCTHTNSFYSSCCMMMHLIAHALIAIAPTWRANFLFNNWNLFRMVVDEIIFVWNNWIGCLLWNSTHPYNHEYIESDVWRSNIKFRSVTWSRKWGA